MQTIRWFTTINYYYITEFSHWMKVEQSPSALSLQEGASSILKCNYSSAVNSVQWFRQNPGGGSLTRLFYIASGMKQSGRLNCTLNAKELFSTLHVAASQLEDSATYLCAVEAQCSLVICSLPPNCRWACSTSTSLGRAFAPTAACAVLQFQLSLTILFSS
uniref:Ig-like domain-containing protein n=1 Tax=Canis lupus dingo TaxID=286419 RepID=A0A8C0K5E4_CANLU